MERDVIRNEAVVSLALHGASHVYLENVGCIDGHWVVVFHVDYDAVEADMIN